jgi:ubiquinone biosynthesis protein
MPLLTAPLAIIFTFLIALIFGVVAQRLLGIRLGIVRLLLAGGFAMLISGPLAVAFLRDYLQREPTPAEYGPAFAWAALALATTVLASMVFLAIIEALVPLGSLPPPLVWGRGLRARLARARRYWQIVGIGLRNGLGPFVRDTRRRALDDTGSRRHLGVALRNTLNAGGVTFVKLGQILSTRPDLLPPEIVDELSALQDRAEPVPWPDVRAVLEADLGGRVDEIFASIDPEPLAAASVGQVHAARLRSGDDVVVKVQRPGIRPVVERDLDIAQRIAGRLELGTGWGRTLGLRSLADGLATALREELDYRVEARNIQTVARAAAARSDGAVRILTVHAALCTERTLVMERLYGTPLNAVDAAPDLGGVDGDVLARSLLDFLLRQILVDGVFHADPHAGNVLLLADGRLGLLDFGSVGRLDAGLREAFQRLLLAVDRGDALGATDALLELVPRPDTVDEQRLERDLGRFLAKHLDAAASSTVRMFGDLFQLIADNGLAIPPELAAVLRSLGTAEGTLAYLSPGFDFVVEARTLAAGFLTEQLQPESLRRAAADELIALVPILRRLPRRVERIASAMEHGRVSVTVRLFADERDRRVVTALLHQVLLAFLAATVGIMAVLLVGTDGGPMVTDTVSLYDLLGYNLLVISGVLGVRVLATIFRQQDR